MSKMSRGGALKALKAGVSINTLDFRMRTDNSTWSGAQGAIRVPIRVYL